MQVLEAAIPVYKYLGLYGTHFSLAATSLTTETGEKYSEALASELIRQNKHGKVSLWGKYTTLTS